LKWGNAFSHKLEVGKRCFLAFYGPLTTAHAINTKRASTNVCQEYIVKIRSLHILCSLTGNADHLICLCTIRLQ